MKIFVGADHNGFLMKGTLVEYLRSQGYEVIDGGDSVLRPGDDFPQFAARVVNALLADEDDESRGILLCGSGQGMCMAANRFAGIRASLCWDVREARASRNDDDANVLCLPVRALTSAQAQTITGTWLTTPFAAAPRYIRRLKELDQLGP